MLNGLTEPVPSTKRIAFISQTHSKWKLFGLMLHAIAATARQANNNALCRYDLLPRGPIFVLHIIFTYRFNNFISHTLKIYDCRELFGLL